MFLSCGAPLIVPCSHTCNCSRDRLDDLRLRRIALDLFAEPRHANVDAAVEGLPVASMRQIQQLVARQHLVGVSGKGVQQVKLHRCQAEFFAVSAHQLVGIQIEQPAPEPGGIGGASGRALFYKCS